MRVTVSWRQEPGKGMRRMVACSGMSVLPLAELGRRLCPPMKVKLLDLQGQYRTMRDEIRAVLDEVCDNQDFILGPRVERFEKHLAEYCGTQHAIGVSSGTDALLCSLMALDIKAGDEVICPPFTFFATAGCIVRAGAKPVFVDIDPRTFNIDPG